MIAGSIMSIVTGASMRVLRIIMSFLAVAVAILTYGCLSLDPFLFDGKSETGYQLDSYSGERECSSYIDQRGPCPAGLISRFSVKSANETVYGIYLRRDSTVALTPADTLMVYFHGQGANIDLYWPRTRMLRESGYPVVIIDYRGFGMSTGKTTEQSLYEDAAAAMAYVHDSLGNPKIIIYSYSLGSIPGVEIASKASAYPSVMMVILEAPIGKVESIVQNGTSLDIPGSYVTTYSGDNADKIKSVTVPLLWLGGTQDETLPRETQGQRVWDNYPDPEHRGRYIVIPGGHHTTDPQTMSPDYNEYIDAIRHFVRDSSDAWFQAK
jgi:pimeloyl-ACP methyl ester carboxylesterase